MKALAHTTTIEDAASEGRYLAMKLLPKRTGLPMAVWLMEQGSAQHDPHIKISLMRDGKGAGTTPCRYASARQKTS
jgi:hypothetical protein